MWADVAAAIAALPQGERDALLLFAWEGMPYDQIATALDVPVGTVRSRLNRARGRLRELVGVSEEEQVAATLRPDRVLPVDDGDPGLFKREKERLMSTIGTPTPQQRAWSHTPTMYPRLVYSDERAALEYLTRVFQFTERREARMEGTDDEGTLAWLEFGDGVVMIGRASDAARDVHHLYSPAVVGHATVSIQVLVDDIDAHYAHAVARGRDDHDADRGRLLWIPALRGRRPRRPPLALPRAARGGQGARAVRRLSLGRSGRPQDRHGRAPRTCCPEPRPPRGATHLSSPGPADADSIPSPAPGVPTPTPGSTAGTWCPPRMTAAPRRDDGPVTNRRQATAL